MFFVFAAFANHGIEEYPACLPHVLRPGPAVLLGPHLHLKSLIPIFLRIYLQPLICGRHRIPLDGVLLLQEAPL